MSIINGPPIQSLASEASVRNLYWSASPLEECEEYVDIAVGAYIQAWFSGCKVVLIHLHDEVILDLVPNKRGPK